MNIKLYNNVSPPNQVKKTLKNEHDIEGIIFKEYDALSLINPTLKIKSTVMDASSIAKYNYFRIPKFSRYYYIESAYSEGGLIVIRGRVDVLMSFKSDILNSEQYIIRSESVQNKYLVDPYLPIESHKKYYVKNFGDPVYNEHCQNVILETIGKGGTPV